MQNIENGPLLCLLRYAQGCMFLLVSILVPPAYSLPEQLEIVWEKQFEDNDVRYEYQTSSLSQNDSIWIVVTSRSKDRSNRSSTFLLWQLDEDGKRVQEHEISKLLGGLNIDDEQKKIHHVAIASTASGEPLLAVGLLNGKLFLAKLNEKTGMASFVKEIGELGSEPYITKILQVGGGKFVLIGRGQKGVIMQVTTSGEVIWQKDAPEEAPVTFINGLVASENQELLLVGTHFNEDGTTNLSVGKYDMQGETIINKSFPGRYGTISIVQGGGYALISDEKGKQGWNVSIRRLSDDLGEVRNIQILTEDELRVLSPFQITSIDNNGLLTVGVKGARLWIANWQKDEEIQWSYLYQQPEASQQWLQNFGLHQGPDSFIVPFTLHFVKENRMRYGVTVIKFKIR